MSQESTAGHGYDRARSIALWNRRYRQAHPEIWREYQRLWRLAFPLKVKKASAEWRIRNLVAARIASNKRSQAYYLKNGKKMRDYQKAYRVKNPEKVALRKKKYSARNAFWLKMYQQLRALAFPELVRAQARKSRQSNIDAVRLRDKQKKLDNRAAYTARDARRRAKMQPCGDMRLIVKIYERARELRRWFNVVVDHIIPVAKGGPHHADNLQIIYAIENNAKSDRLDYIPSVIFS